MIVFIGFSLIYVNLAVSNYNTIDICKQPFGRKLCTSLCNDMSGCSVIEYSYDHLYCHVGTGPTPFKSPYDVSTWETSNELEPMTDVCPEHSRSLTTRKGSRVCVADNNIGVSRIKLSGSRAYYLGDYNVEVIGRTSLLLRMITSNTVDIEFGHGAAHGKRIRVTISHIYVMMTMCTMPRFQCQTVSKVNLKEAFWDSCGSTELWFRWNSSGSLALGKGWILGRNLVLQYEGIENIPVSTVTVKTGSKTVTIIVDVKHENYHAKVPTCNNDISTRAPNFTRVSMTRPKLTYALCDYDIPSIGQNTAVMRFDVKRTLIIHFSQHYETNKYDVRRVTFSMENGIAVTNCVKGPAGESKPACGHHNVGALVKYTDGDKVIIWLMWDQLGYFGLGSGWTPGANRYMAHWWNTTLPINYLKLQPLKRGNIHVGIEMCSS